MGKRRRGKGRERGGGGGLGGGRGEGEGGRGGGGAGTIMNTIIICLSSAQTIRHSVKHVNKQTKNRQAFQGKNKSRRHGDARPCFRCEGTKDVKEGMSRL